MAREGVQFEKVVVEVMPYPSHIRTRMKVTITGASQAMGNNVWRGGREVTVLTEAPTRDADMRAQLEETLARALDELEALS